jgi:predicted nucleic acid-binding protein
MIVTDASVWVSTLFATDAMYARSLAWLQQELSNEQVFVVPSIFLAEVAGAASRRSGNPLLGRSVIGNIVTLKSFDVRDIDRDLAIRAAEIAAALPLKGADALYVALAQQLNLPLFTWDREQLQRGAQIVAVQTPDAGGAQSG